MQQERKGKVHVLKEQDKAEGSVTSIFASDVA